MFACLKSLDQIDHASFSRLPGGGGTPQPWQGATQPLYRCNPMCAAYRYLQAHLVVYRTLLICNISEVRSFQEVLVPRLSYDSTSPHIKGTDNFELVCGRSFAVAKRRKARPKITSIATSDISHRSSIPTTVHDLALSGQLLIVS